MSLKVQWYSVTEEFKDSLIRESVEEIGRDSKGLSNIPAENLLFFIEQEAFDAVSKSLTETLGFEISGKLSLCELFDSFDESGELLNAYVSVSDAPTSEKLGTIWVFNKEDVKSRMGTSFDPKNVIEPKL